MSLTKLDERAKEPEVARENRLRAIEKARKGWYGGKPGPKVFKSGEEFMKYWLQRMETERSDVEAFIQAYAKQPFFLRAQLVQSELMRNIWDAIIADVALGVLKLPRERWTALSKIVDMQRSLRVEEQKNERKMGREHLKQKEADRKSEDNVHEAYVVEADD